MGCGGGRAEKGVTRTEGLFLGNEFFTSLGGLRKGRGSLAKGTRKEDGASQIADEVPKGGASTGGRGGGLQCNFSGLSCAEAGPAVPVFSG